MIPDDDTRNQEDTGDAAAPRSQADAICSDYKQLAAAGFSKEQIADQLSVKHNVLSGDLLRTFDQYDEEQNA